MAAAACPGVLVVQGIEGDKFQFLIDNAEIALRDGAQLFSWWKERELAGTLRKFPLVPSQIPGVEMLGFYDTSEFAKRNFTVMGCLQKIRFPRKQIVSPGSGLPLDAFLRGRFMQLATWKRPDGSPGGFGYRSLKGRLKSGTYEDFSAPPGRFVDLQQIGHTYDWIVYQVDIYDFVRGLPSMQRFASTLSKFMKESAYVVASADYSTSFFPRPADAVAECCFGYSFLPCEVAPNFFGFGPGRFAMAIKQFRFLLFENGDVEIHLAFVVAPRSQKVLYLWGFDPVYSSIHLVDLLTLGKLGIKRLAHDALDSIMLALHGRVHQNLLQDMCGTWENQDWTTAGGADLRLIKPSDLRTATGGAS